MPCIIVWYPVYRPVCLIQWHHSCQVHLPSILFVYHLVFGYVEIIHFLLFSLLPVRFLVGHLFRQLGIFVLFVFKFSFFRFKIYSNLIRIPMALFYLFSHRYRMKFIRISIISAIIISLPIIIIDTYYYGKFVFAPINIILYNVFSEHGSTLYGTEPFSFYLKNLFLNFNIFFIISSLSIPVLVSNFTLWNTSIYNLRF